MTLIRTHWVCISICCGRGQKWPYMGIICPYMGIIICKLYSSNLIRTYSTISTAKLCSDACSIVRTLRRCIIKDRYSKFCLKIVLDIWRHDAMRNILNNWIDKGEFWERVPWYFDLFHHIFNILIYFIIFLSTG